MEREFYYKLIDICCVELGYKLIFKLHPRCPTYLNDIILELRNHYKDLSLLEFRSKGDVTEMMDEEGVFLTYFSSAVYYALLKGIPIVSLSYISDYFKMDLETRGAAVNISSPEQIKDVLSSVMETPEIRTSLLENSKQVIEDVFYKLDGQSSTRVARFLGSLARKQ